MKGIKENSHMIDSLSCILNILGVNDLSLTLFITSSGIHLNPKQSKYVAVFPSIYNETQCVPLLFYH